MQVNKNLFLQKHSLLIAHKRNNTPFVKKFNTFNIASIRKGTLLEIYNTAHLRESYSESHLIELLLKIIPLL